MNQRVEALGIMHGGYNIVSHDKRPVIPGRGWQHESDGWFIYSNISNETKVIDLNYISDTFGLNLIIEEGKPQ